MDEAALLKWLQRKLTRLRKEWPEQYSDYQLEKKLKISREWIRFLEGRRPTTPKKTGAQSPGITILHRYVTFFGKDLEWLFQTIPERYKEHSDNAVYQDVETLLNSEHAESVRVVLASLKAGFLKEKK